MQAKETGAVIKAKAKRLQALILISLGGILRLRNQNMMVKSGIRQIYDYAEKGDIDTKDG